MSIDLWKEIGLKPEAHDGLYAVLTDTYKKIYSSQKNRPEMMKYFDDAVSQIYGDRLRNVYKAKQKGSKIIGTLCVYVPEEIILALDGLPVSLCSGSELGFEDAEKYIPRNTCSLIKAFMGSKLAGLCPYVELADIIVGETTCDGKKKAYELFNDITNKMYVMELPNKKCEEGRELWKNEVKSFAKKMEELTERKLTLENLKNASIVLNEKRKALQRLSFLRSHSPSPISGLDALLANQMASTDKINELCDELEQRVKYKNGVCSEHAPRILIAGSPMALPNWKVHSIIENSGAVVVGEECCSVERKFRDLVKEEISSVEEGLDFIAERYLTIDCACFTPNDERLKNIKYMFENLHASGIVYYSLQHCTPYMFEAYKVKKACSEWNIPFLHIETDYSLEDIGQLKTRIEAFIEMVKSH